MTTRIHKRPLGSALIWLVFLILMIIVLLMIPASAFASGDDNPEIENAPTTERSASTDQSGGFEGSNPTVQFESPAAYDQNTTASFSEGLAYDDPGSDNPDTGIFKADSSIDVDTTSGEQELAPPEAGASNADNSTGINDNPALGTPSSQPDEQPESAEVNTNSEIKTGDSGNNGLSDGPDLPTLETEGSPIDDAVAGEATSSATSYFQVQEVSMSPLLNPGSIVEVTSATYADGDMVVAQKSDGTYIVKMLSGDQLVPLGAGTIYPVEDVTILGAANLSSMTAESLEQSGLSWHTALAQTAVKPAGSGTLEDPFLIASLENLFWITAPGEVDELTQAQRWYANKNYKQTDNIDASATSTWYTGAGWLPIGNSGTKFRGTYNGQGFTISGLFINRPADNYIGLFGDVGSDAVLQNIKLENVDITGKDYVGGLSGKNSKGEIINCYVTGSINGGVYVGGLVGENDESGKISNSNTTGSVTGNNTVGGLAGINQGTIYNSSSSATLNGIFFLGGLVGQNSDGGNIRNCSASGTVSGDNSIGGLIGQNSGAINYSRSSGTVSGDSTLGGLVGHNLSGTITNSYANNTVTGVTSLVGGLVGYNSGDSTISRSYAKGTITGGTDVGGLVGKSWLTSGTIENSYTQGVVKGGDMVGGLIGFSVTGEIKNCYAAGTVEGVTKVGGLVGQNNSASMITYCVWDSEVNNDPDLLGVGNGPGYAHGYNTTQMKELATYQNTIIGNPWDIAGQDGSYPVLGWQVNWSDNIWYMGTPPTPDHTNGGNFGGGFGFFDFEFPPGLALLSQNGSGLTTITGQGNAPITPGIIASGSWNDLNQAVAAYQAALVSLENNITTLSPAELALLEVELAIARAAILALEAKLLAADGQPYDLAALQAAYAAAVATVTANQSSLSSNQMAAANQLLAAIADVIAALQ